MATLVSPGVAVSVIDESFYGTAGAGTVPLIVCATGQDKAHVSGTGYAAGTIKSMAGKPQLITSQRELVQTFGTPYFRSVSGTASNGDEVNEYGLLAAYSYLGAANRAYVVRADVNTTQLLNLQDLLQMEQFGGILLIQNMDYFNIHRLKEHGLSKQ